MNGLEVRDMHPRGYLAFDLKEMLACLSNEAVRRTWTCGSVECIGAGTNVLESLSESGQSLTGAELVRISDSINQVIWGDFFGALPEESAASLVVKAIDSTLWEVFGNDQCLDLIRSHFKFTLPIEYKHG